MKSEYVHPDKVKFLKRIGMTEKELKAVQAWKEDTVSSSSSSV